MSPETSSSPRAEGLVALVTGAGSGIGRATCFELAARGARAIVLLDRHAEGLEETRAGLAVRDTAAAIRQLDVTDDAALESAFAAAIEDWGRLDLVHNNAGIMTGLPVYPEIDLAKCDEVIAVNLRAVLAGTKLAHRALSATGGGSILNTASGAGKTPFPPDPVYGATKAAVVSLTRSCAPAFARAGIRINALCPSIVDTPILEQNGNGVRPEALRDGSIPLLDPAEVAKIGVDLMLDPARNGETPSVFPEG